MLSLITLVVTALLAAFAVAQAPTTTFNSSVVNQIIQEVGLTTLNSWCTSEVTTCGQLCGGQTSENSCIGSSLNYTCTCTSNSSSPALQYYQGTIPSFVCNRAKGDCMATNANDLSAQQQCNVTYVCGNSNASMAAVAPTTTSSMPASTATGSATTSPSATATKASAAIRIGQEYGAGLLIACMLTVMGLYL